MRTFLRLLAAVLCGTTIVLSVLLIGAAFYDSYQLAPVKTVPVWLTFPRAATPLFMLAITAALGGLLWCQVAYLPAPPPPPAAPTRPRWPRSFRKTLRVLAGVQLGIGGIVLGATVVVAALFILERPSQHVAIGLWALVGTFFAFVATSLGGVLWCAVRLAYPEPPTAPGA